MFQDISEIFPILDCTDLNTLQSSIKKFNYIPNKNRLDGLQILLGNEVLNKLLNTKIMVVGAGAIGCELIKNFSMLNVGTGENGSIYITDPDNIETSNLTRQFLFREKHIRFPKSTIAAAAAIQMNPNLKHKIFAKIDKVSEETENIFTDKFISELNLIANALDNINARRYIDSRCVSNRIPLLESGTLGPKGHVQVIIPFKTESYSSQNDPEVSNDIPQCTLKMFPEEAIHCVEWARDQFGKIFSQLPKIINKTINEFNPNNKIDEIKIMKKTLKWMKKYPKNFEDCLILARHKFNKVFCNNIKQLLYAYPLDKKDKQGKLFWTLPKRPPEIDNFDVNDNLCIDFISAYACLMANMFNIKIPYEKPRDANSKKEMTLKVKDIKVEEFKPNEEKLKAIEKEVEEEENKTNKNNDEKDKEKENNNVININAITDVTEEENIIKELENILKNNKNIKPLKSTEFEKDNDDNFHIDIIYAMSALRCRNYKLEIMDWLTVKLKAGRIIPALATTTSSIAALQSLELIKIIKNLPLEQYRNSFLNLAIPYLQSSEPGVCQKVVIHEGLTTTLWDRWEINLENNKRNIKNLFDILRNKYKLFPKDIFKGKKPVYSFNAYKDKKDLNENIINKDLCELLDIDPKQDEYVDLMIMFTKDENSEEYLKDIPKVRIYFQK
jgi:ubiquitin-activating enzyme E1